MKQTKVAINQYIRNDNFKTLIFMFLLIFFCNFRLVTMETIQFKFNDQCASFENYLDFYLKNKSRDCILFSEDGSKYKVHKELFGQTDFLRKILSSTKDQCCGTIEVSCPCSKDELSSLVNFLCDGEIHCEEESESLKIIENLQNIFGFQRTLNPLH